MFSSMFILLFGSHIYLFLVKINNDSFLSSSFSMNMPSRNTILR